MIMQLLLFSFSITEKLRGLTRPAPTSKARDGSAAAALTYKCLGKVQNIPEDHSSEQVWRTRNKACY